MLLETPTFDFDSETVVRAASQMRHPTDIEAGVLEYQPIIALQSGALRGLASVLRRRRPGALTVGIGPIVGPVLAHACVEARYWPGCRMSVPVSARLLLGADLLAHVDAALSISGLPPSRLDIELGGQPFPEAASEAASNTWHGLKERGVGVVLGDLGAGAGLRLLDVLQPTAVRLDRGLVRGLPLDPRSCAAATTIMSAAHKLGMRVIADGVETLAQRDWLVRAGCDEAQGTLYSRALPPERLAALLDYGVDTCPIPRSTSETRYDRAVPH